MPSVPEANRPRDNHTPLVVDTAAPSPVQDDAVTLIQGRVILLNIKKNHLLYTPSLSLFLKDPFFRKKIISKIFIF